MSRSGKSMNNHTKGFKKAKGKNTTISYKRMRICSSNKWSRSNISQSHKTKDQARQEAADMASKDLGFF